ncbi:MAG: hypothetical protein KAY32_09825 [Candidatus Eisenbacteria sp.]|nr:hypothetical protein [Candidatus Eisenbacteria bacterium]
MTSRNHHHPIAWAAAGLLGLAVLAHGLNTPPAFGLAAPGPGQPTPSISEVEVVGIATSAASGDSIVGVPLVGVEALTAAAIRDAFEKAGLWITRTRNLLSISDSYGLGGAISTERVRASLQDCIDSYEVLETTIRDSSALATVRLRVNEERIDEVGLGRLQILPIVGGRAFASDADALADEIRAALGAALADSGIRVLEPLQVVSISRDPEQLLSIGKRNRADLLLIVECSSRDLDQLGSFVRREYRAEVRLVAGYTGQALAEHSFVREGERHYDATKMLSTAGRALGGEIGEYTLAKLDELGERILVRRVKVCNIPSHEEAEWVAQALEGIGGVHAVRLLLFDETEGGCAFFQIETAADLYNRLGIELQRLGGASLHVTSESPSWIEAVID